MNCWKNAIKSWIKPVVILIKGFDSEPLYNEKYLKANINSYGSKININFYDDRIPKESSHFICISIILLILRLKQVKTIIYKKS